MGINSKGEVKAWVEVAQHRVNIGIMSSETHEMVLNMTKLINSMNGEMPSLHSVIQILPEEAKEDIPVLWIRSDKINCQDFVKMDFFTTNFPL